MRDITLRGIIMGVVRGIRIAVTDIRIAGATMTDGVIGIATREAAMAIHTLVFAAKEDLGITG